MAFIRLYASRAAMGDPFLGIKFPKIRLPKIQPFKLLTPGNILSAASFVPGPIGAIGRVGKLAKIGAAAKTVAKLGGAAAVFGAASQLGSNIIGPGYSGPMVAPGQGTAPGGTVTALPGAYGRVRKRYRRMNVANMKALTRASRRVHRFAKLARTCIRQSKTVRCPRKGARGRTKC